MGDNIFLGLSVLAIGIVLASYWAAYLLGKKQGAKEYYLKLTKSNQEDQIQ